MMPQYRITRPASDNTGVTCRHHPPPEGSFRFGGRWFAGPEVSGIPNLSTISALLSVTECVQGARLSPRRDLPAPEPRPPPEFHPTNVTPLHRQSQSTPEGSHTQEPLTPEEAALTGFRGGGALTVQSRMSGRGGWPYRLVFTTQFPLLPIALSPHIGALQQSV